MLKYLFIITMLSSFNLYSQSQRDSLYYDKCHQIIDEVCIEEEDLCLKPMGFTEIIKERIRIEHSFNRDITQKCLDILSEIREKLFPQENASEKK